MKLRLTLLVCSLTIACGGAPTKTPMAGTEQSISPSMNGTEKGGQEALSGDLGVKTAPPGTITRQDLDAVLRAGPAAILSMVITEPVLKNGRFVGFKIARFTGKRPTAIDLRSGDVILKANGKTVERPEHYFAVLEDLKIATELRIEVLRDGEKTTLIYPILNKSQHDVSAPTRAQ